MRFRLATRVLAILVSFLAFLPMSAQDDCFPARPNTLILDQANILSQAEESALNQALVNFDNSNSVQIMVVTVTDLCGMDASQFTYEIGERWGSWSRGV